MQHLIHRMARLGARFGGCRKGNSSVELGLSIPVLMLLTFGAIDYGSAYVEGLRLTGAARAGAQYPLYAPTDWDDTAVVERVALEEYMGRSLTDSEIQTLAVSAVADTFCGCSDSTTLACSASCPGGAAPGRFMRVTLRSTVPLTLPYPWSPEGEFDVARQAVVRAR